MSDAAIFVLIFGGMFVLRFVAATLVFLWILPEGDRCPLCDAVTLRVEPSGFGRLFPWMRSSWCHDCGWEGMLRTGPLTPPPGPLPPSLPGPGSPGRRAARRRDVRRKG